MSFFSYCLQIFLLSFVHNLLTIMCLGVDHLTSLECIDSSFSSNVGSFKPLFLYFFCFFSFLLCWDSYYAYVGTDVVPQYLRLCSYFFILISSNSSYQINSIELSSNSFFYPLSSAIESFYWTGFILFFGGFLLCMCIFFNFLKDFVLEKL